MTELLGREAQAFLARQTPQQPFLLCLAFGAPHYSMIAAVDDVVGALLNQLKKLRVEDETVVFFQADNGATREERASGDGLPNTGGSNGRYRGYKLGLFEGGMHVPAILHAPGLPARQVTDRPMMSMDLLPTFLAMADPGAMRPAGIDGHDLQPVLSGKAQPHEALFWNHDRQRAVRMGDWKLILNPPNFPGEAIAEKVWLSNLEADPSERKNLASAESERVRKLTEAIRAWEQDVALARE